MIRAVVFDVGETLIDETRHWGEWADWLGVPRLTFFATLGVVIERGEHHRAVFDLVRPGIDLVAETERRRAAGSAYRFEAADFYPDALPCLRALRAAGYRIGIAGNQPREAEAALTAAGVPADFVRLIGPLGRGKALRRLLRSPHRSRRRPRRRHRLRRRPPRQRHPPRPRRPLTPKQIRMRTKQEQTGGIPMFRLARESLALVSVVGFVWMVCQVAQFAG